MIKLTEIKAPEFDQFANNHELGSIYQDSRWAKVKADSWQAKYVAGIDNKLITIASLILIRKLPLGFKIWYLPRGPLFDTKQPSVLKDFSNQLLKMARQDRAIIVKADPNILLSSSSFSDAKSKDSSIDNAKIELFGQAGWRHQGLTKSLTETIQPRFNAVLYLNEDSWLTQLPKKTTKIIDRGKKMGLVVRSIDQTEIDDFMLMIKATESRKNISLRSHAYFHKIKSTFGDDCLLTLTSIDPKTYLENAKQNLAEINNELKNTNPNRHNKLRELNAQKQSAERFLTEAKQFSEQYSQPIPLSSSMSLYKNKTLEMLYSGMDKRFNRFYAPHVSNWFRFDWAYKKGAKKCNLGGVDGSLSDSLSEFKSAFGVNIDELVGEFNLYPFPVISWAFDKLLPIAKKIIKKLRQLKS